MRTPYQNERIYVNGCSRVGLTRMRKGQRGIALDEQYSVLGNAPTTEPCRRTESHRFQRAALRSDSSLDKLSPV